jgi:pre-60S factor REI1
LELEQKADDDEEEGEIAIESTQDNTSKKAKDTEPLLDCLFCSHFSLDIDTNLTHMSKSHGFFLPDIEYLKDREGLVRYLSHRIHNDKMCLYCNGRGKEWQSAAAARAHMLDRGHCKMAYDESEDPEQLLKYYDFDIEELMDVDTAEKLNGNELVLQSGIKLGHRKFLKDYKKNHLRKVREDNRQEFVVLMYSYCIYRLSFMMQKNLFNSSSKINLNRFVEGKDAI